MKRVASKLSMFEFVLATDAGTNYADNDVIDTVKTLSNVGRFGLSSGRIVSAVVTNKTTVSENIDLHFFTQNPSNSTFTDNSGFDPDDADLIYMLPTLSLTKHTDFVDNSISQPAVDQQPIPFELDVVDTVQGVNLYMVAVAKAAMNLEGATDLKVRVFVEHD